MVKVKKIIHLPSSVGGMAWALSKGENELGHLSEVLYTDNSWLKYPCDKQVKLGSSKTINSFKLCKEFLAIRKKYDVFHFNFGKSLVEMNQFGVKLAELPFYPKGKRLLMTFNGCDARQKFRTMKKREIAACHDHKCYNGMCNSGRLDRKRYKNILKASKYIDHMFAVNPDLLHFLPSEKSSFLPYAVLDSEKSKIPILQKKEFLIVHAPTQREAKGSYEIIKAVKSLQAEDSSINFALIENIKHSEALKLYREADLVIDQVKIGWYGALAVECMYMSKPVAVYIDKGDLALIPKEMARDLESSVINITPDNILVVLKEFIDDSQKLREIGDSARDYAHKWHSPTSVAKEILNFI